MNVDRTYQGARLPSGTPSAPAGASIVVAGSDSDSVADGQEFMILAAAGASSAAAPVTASPTAGVSATPVQAAVASVTPSQSVITAIAATPGKPLAVASSLANSGVVASTSTSVANSVFANNNPTSSSTATTTKGAASEDLGGFKKLASHAKEAVADNSGKAASGSKPQDARHAAVDRVLADFDV